MNAALTVCQTTTMQLNLASKSLTLTHTCRKSMTEEFSYVACHVQRFLRYRVRADRTFVPKSTSGFGVRNDPRSATNQESCPASVVTGLSWPFGVPKATSNVYVSGHDGVVNVDI